jgi:hypothetical protein
MDKMALFDDPKMVHKQRVMAKASFSAFNAVATRLVADLARIYPKDMVIRMMAGELEAISKDRKKVKLGAANFFREIRQPSQREGGAACQYADLLVAHSDLAFADPIPVMVLREAGMAAKWQEMGPELKTALWAYIDRLVHLSAQAMFSNSTATEEMNSLGRAVVGAAVAGHGRSSDELARDPAVQKTANAFVESIK